MLGISRVTIRPELEKQRSVENVRAEGESKCRNDQAGRVRGKERVKKVGENDKRSDEEGRHQP